jgi:large subunit ribosomal protein L19e
MRVFMTIQTVKRLAADILNVGVNRIRIKPENVEKAAEALTRQDVKALIDDGTIYKIKKRGRRKKKKKRKRGEGSIKGHSAKERKRRWMILVRSQRACLKELLKNGLLEKKYRKMIYRKIKSGTFKSKKAMLTYLKENNLLKENKEGSVVS